MFNFIVLIHVYRSVSQVSADGKKIGSLSRSIKHLVDHNVQKLYSLFQQAKHNKYALCNLWAKVVLTVELIGPQSSQEHPRELVTT